MSPPISPHAFSLLARLVEERAGLYYSVNNLDIFREKVLRRAALAGFDSALEYYYFLRYDPASEAEFDAFLDSLVVGETYLFREADQLRGLVTEILAPAVAAGRRPRVWSAACSTGEEPLTLAMLLAEQGLSRSVAIVASDVSQAALDRARRGELGRRALRKGCPAACSRWIEVWRDGSIHASAELCGTIAWRRVNLWDPAQIQAMGRFDAILCRNVLIYFSERGTRRVVEALHDALTPGGYLLVGASESLLQVGTLYTLEERRGSFYYRKVGA